MTLTRQTLGRLAAYAATPVAGISTAFDTADWTPATGLSLSLVSGALRVTAAGSASTRVTRYTPVGVIEDVMVQAVCSGATGVGGSAGVSARTSTEAVPVSRASMLVPVVGAGSEGLGETSGPNTDLAAVAERTPPQRFALALTGSAVVGRNLSAGTQYAVTTALPANYVGLWTSSGGGYTRTFSEFYVCRSRFLTVTGLPSGWDVQVLSAADGVLATATESGGTATVDMLAVALPDARKVRVRDGSGTPVATETPAEAVWGGDVWAFTPDTPTGLTVTPASSSALDVAWDATPGATSYVAERSADGVSGWTTVYTGATPSFTDTGLLADTEYFYRVRACAGAGCSAYSAPASGTTHPLPLTAYRLRVRTASTITHPNGDADALVITSLGGGTNPYLATPPEGDGEEIDLLTGQRRTGAYRVRVIDAEVTNDGEGWGFDWGFNWGGGTSGTQRVVTRALEDVQYRQQLLSRRAYVEITRDAGLTWEELYAGYVTSIILSTAIAYDFTIGDTRRIETSRRIFTWSPTPGPTGISERDVFPSRGCLAGGPIIDGFGPLNDTGGDQWWLTEVTGDSIYPSRQIATFALRFGNFVGEAFLPPDYRRSRNLSAVGAYYEKALQPFAVSGPQQVMPGALSTLFLGSWTRYPNVTVIIDDRGGGLWYGTLQVFNRQGDVYGGPTFSVLLDPTDTPPTAGAPKWIRLVTSEVTETAPLYVDDHPVNIVTDLFDVVGIEYDQDTADDVRAYLGEELRYALRITEPRVMAEFLASSVFGPFGFSVRNSPSGAMEFILTRPMGTIAPSITIPTDSVRSQEPPIFTLEEEQVVSSFKVSYGVLSVSTLNPNDSPPPPPDGIIEGRVQVILENSDQTVFSTREVVYEFAGMVHLAGAWEPSIAALVESIARYGFDRYGRGAPVAEVDLIDGEPGSEARLGDEVYLDVASYPNRGYRIGESSVGARIMQVVRRTETPSGPRLKLVDAGLNQQPVSPDAEISIAQSAGAPRTVANFTIDNAADINAAAVLSVAVEYATGMSAPAENGALFVRYAPGECPTTAQPLPSLRPGSTVWVRARTEQVERRPSAWTAWTSVTLVAFGAPSGVTLSDETAESITVTWTNASPAYFTEVFIAPGTTPPADWGIYRMNIFLPGSTRAVIRGLSDATDYIVGVAHRDQGTGERTTVATATTTTAPDPVDAPTPLAMLVVPAIEDAGEQTGIGVALWAADETFDIEISRANDSSGIPGPWSTIARVPGTTQVYRDILPSDGLVRWYRIRHVLPGYDPSPYTGSDSASPASLPLNLSRPALAPVLNVYTVDNGTDVDIYWNGTGTVEVSIDGGAYGTPGASPINVAKTAVNQTYQFRATLNGLTVFSLAIVGPDAATVPALLTATATEATAIACAFPWEIDVAWTTTDPNDTAYHIRILNFDTAAIVADGLTTVSSSYLDNTAETGDPLFTGVNHTRRYTVQVIRSVDDAVIDSLDTTRLDVETGPAC